MILNILQKFLFFTTTAALISVRTAVWGQGFRPSDVPDPKLATGGCLSDPSGVLTSDEAQTVNDLCAAIEAVSGPQTAVVVLESVGDEEPRPFGVELFRHWGVGKKGKDDGLMLLVVMDRRYAGLITGYGIEHLLTDAACRHILDTRLVPHFKEKRYGKGVTNTLMYLRDAFSNVDERKELEAFGRYEVGPGPLISVFWRSLKTGFLIVAERWNVGPPQGVQRPSSFPTFFMIFVFFVTMLVVFAVRNAQGFRQKMTKKNLSNIELLVLSVYFPLMAAAPVYLSTAFGERAQTSWSIFHAYAQLSLFHGAVWLKRTRYYSRREHRVSAYTGLRDDYRENCSWMFPAVRAVYHLIYLTTLYSIRRRPMTSSGGKSMRMARGDERERNLAQGHKLEVRLKASEIDVWLADGEVEIVRYPAYLKPFHECGVCRFWTASYERRVVVTEPTETDFGLGYDVYRCQNCGNEERNYKTLPKKTGSSGGGGYASSAWSSSDSSSWDSSSSGGGSDWGGGDSGGGGADSSW